MRPSSVALFTGVILAGFTVWITRQAKALEQDLDGNAMKIALLDKAAPDFHLTAVDGRSVSLADYGGRKLALVFWATWNNVSHPAMLMLSQLDRQSDRQNRQFDVVAVAVDDQLDAVKQFVVDSRIAFPVALDRNRALTDTYQIRSIPTILIVEDGKVTYGSTGMARGGQGELMRRLGMAGQFRMEMGAPGGRGN